MLVSAGRAGTDRFVAQAGIESVLVQFSEFRQERSRPGLGGEDAADGGEGEGAEARGMLQGCQYIAALVMGEQRQELLGLQLALHLLGEQAVEELHGAGTELLEALPQQGGALVGIVGRMMALEDLALTGHGRGQQRVPGDLFESGRIEDDLVRGDAHGQHLADVRPGRRVAVRAPGDEALDVDETIDHAGRVEVAGRQGQQVRPLPCMALQRRFLELA